MCSRPGISGTKGVPPVATSRWRAVWRLPSISTVCASTSWAQPVTSVTPEFFSSEP
ncbi:hypothetical protein D3C87_1906070 [compost metagenome]